MKIEIDLGEDFGDVKIFRCETCFENCILLSKGDIGSLAARSCPFSTRTNKMLRSCDWEPVLIHPSFRIPLD